MAAAFIPKRLVSSELVNFAARQPKAFVRLCEQRYEARIAAAAQKAADSGCQMVMLTGPSSSGKTTSANRLAGAIAAMGKPADVISLDDFFVGSGRYPKRADGADDYECLEALDLPQLCACLSDLAKTGECDVPQFDFVAQQPSGETRHVDGRGGVVVIEGLHAFNPALTQQLPGGTVYRIYAGLREEYCDAAGMRTVDTRTVRLARRMTRDCLFRGHNADFTLDLWPHVCESENRYIKIYKSNADCLLDTSFTYEVCLWADVIEPLQGTVGDDPDSVARVRAMCRSFADFVTMKQELVPTTSMLREFIGNNS